MAEQKSAASTDGAVLTERQATVLRAMVKAYVGEASPIGSQTITYLLSTPVSSASVRSTLAELAELGLVEKPHACAGRVPTERGLRLFVDQLLDRDRLDASNLAAYELRTIAQSVDDAEPDSVVAVASQLLSERTRQLGFVVAPRVDSVVLSSVSLVRLSTERILAVLVSRSGNAYRRVIEGSGKWPQRDLNRMAALLSDRVAGRTLAGARAALVREAAELRHRADDALTRAIELGRRAVAMGDDEVDLVIGTRLALLDQPEFHDTRRVRDLFEALETKHRLLEVLDQMMETGCVTVAFGEEVDEPGLRRCALVATRYGGEDAPLGTLGVIGPARMDYGRVIPLVDYLSHVITDRFS